MSLQSFCSTPSQQDDGSSNKTAAVADPTIKSDPNLDELKTIFNTLQVYTTVFTLSLFLPLSLSLFIFAICFLLLCLFVIVRLNLTFEIDVNF